MSVGSQVTNDKCQLAVSVVVYTLVLLSSVSVPPSWGTVPEPSSHPSDEEEETDRHLSDNDRHLSDNDRHLSDNDRHLSDNDCSYLVPSEELNNYEIEVINGNKAGSKWLVIEKTYICHANAESTEGEVTYWECKRRRHDR